MCKTSHYLHHSLYAKQDLPFPSLEKLEECPFILLDTSPPQNPESKKSRALLFFSQHHTN